MARYTGAVCRLCRREGQKLFLKGERCYTAKCSVARRAYAPGQHGQGRKKTSVESDRIGGNLCTVLRSWLLGFVCLLGEGSHL